jgi:demethylmenaquinone methyltransferase/2-methoxy-6-polyprenyl-1,4-benzoquinol methylase
MCGRIICYKEAVMSKGSQVQKMFDDIADNYDLMNRVMTMGQDQKWRRFLVDKTGSIGADDVLDLATGTGDIASLLQLSYPQARVIGADFSQNMLKTAKKRFAGQKIIWQVSDANSLPFPDNCFAAVTCGYLLRNVEDVDAVLREIHRVLKPGGRFVALDTTPPKRNLLYPFINGYLRFIIPLLGKLVAQDKSAYNYLIGSTMDFYAADRLGTMFAQAGFCNNDHKKFMLGTIAVHWGEKGL